MARLSEKDLQRLLGYLRELYAARDHDGLVTHLVSSLPGLVATDMAAYNEVDPVGRTMTAFAAPEPVGVESLVGAFESHMHEHPLLNYHRQTGDGAAVKFSDFLSQRELHRLGLYQECYRKIDAEHQMSLAPATDSSLTIGIALNRSGMDFTERDRLVLNLLRPHVSQALVNARSFTRMQQLALLGQAAEESGQAIIVLSPFSGRVEFSTARARCLLATFFAHSRPDLPDDLKRWITHHQALRSGTGLPPVYEPWIVTRAARRLSVRLIVSEDKLLLLLHEEREGVSPEALAGFGLTRRESEILAWVLKGKRNQEIAASLYISASTVKKHLEHVYEKLGVSSRAQAIARVMALFDHVDE